MTSPSTIPADVYGNRDSFLAAAGATMRSCFSNLPSAATTGDRAKMLQSALTPGKMLRSRLAWALCPQEENQQAPVIAAAAATELLHNATLFHDDVIDDAAVRRSRPALWQQIGANGAILLGDLFFCSALDILAKSDSNRNLVDFIARINEVCAAEVTHELACRGVTLDTESAKAIAKGKTGALFAFVAESCGSDNETLRDACREAGYAVGTAYQLADDLLDEAGSEDATGKTLGTDRNRNKFTLAQADGLTHQQLAKLICDLCDSAVETLSQWPDRAERLRNYVDTDLLPEQIRTLSKSQLT